MHWDAALDAHATPINIRRGEMMSHIVSLVAGFPTLAWRMMMAYDSSLSPPSRLDDATLDSLRAALGQYLADEGTSHQLRDVLLRMAVEARAKAILPEHLLIALKDVWSALPEVRHMSQTAEQVRLLQRVVTMCIKEYYSV